MEYVFFVLKAGMHCTQSHLLDVVASRERAGDGCRRGLCWRTDLQRAAAADPHRRTRGGISAIACLPPGALGGAGGARCARGGRGPASSPALTTAAASPSSAALGSAAACAAGCPAPWPARGSLRRGLRRRMSHAPARTWLAPLWPRRLAAPPLPRLPGLARQPGRGAMEGGGFGRSGRRHHGHHRHGPPPWKREEEGAPSLAGEGRRHEVLPVTARTPPTSLAATAPPLTRLPLGPFPPATTGPAAPAPGPGRCTPREGRRGLAGEGSTARWRKAEQGRGRREWEREEGGERVGREREGVG
ncbi:hypothetical protein PVAP13_8NG321812 [Panicum virgatum]|uniref:Uncharacterized protein n=1 Tax=Panicum virgatum TaxID=38727 RepID=A0A8T0PAX0_PANVG|nr:hypothetical protein PVAP13_8NG321812 [Panicum virgatum]